MSKRTGNESTTRRQELNLELERWAEALAVDRQHGNRTPDFIAERVAILVKAGDTKGVARWLEIASLCDRLRGGTIH